MQRQNLKPIVRFNRTVDIIDATIERPPIDFKQLRSQEQSSSTTETKMDELGQTDGGEVNSGGYGSLDDREYVEIPTLTSPLQSHARSPVAARQAFTVLENRQSRGLQPSPRTVSESEVREEIYGLALRNPRFFKPLIEASTHAPAGEVVKDLEEVFVRYLERLQNEFGPTDLGPPLFSIEEIPPKELWELVSRAKRSQKFAYKDSNDDWDFVHGGKELRHRFGQEEQISNSNERPGAEIEASLTVEPQGFGKFHLDAHFENLCEDIKDMVARYKSRMDSSDQAEDGGKADGSFIVNSQIRLDDGAGKVDPPTDKPTSKISAGMPTTTSNSMYSNLSCLLYDTICPARPNMQRRRWRCVSQISIRVQEF